MPGLLDEAMIPPPQAFWVEGHVISSEAAPPNRMRDLSSARAKKQSFTRRQNESMEKMGDQNIAPVESR